jgi:hypothetical protein
VMVVEREKADVAWLIGLGVAQTTRTNLRQKFADVFHTLHYSL